MTSLDSFVTTEAERDPDIDSFRPSHSLEIEPKQDLFEPEQPTARPLLFKRWVNSFRAKQGGTSSQPRKVVEGWVEGSQDEAGSTKSLLWNGPILEDEWRFSGHSSNLESIKTSTFSIASQSLIRSRRTTKSDGRDSTDSSRLQSNFVDSEAYNRALKRRQVLRELITSESEYIFGLKALTDVLYLFSARPGVYYNLQNIRKIHENFFSSLQKLSPMSNTSESDFKRVAFSIGRNERARTNSSSKPPSNSSLRSGRSRTMINHRVMALIATANEALEAALEVQGLSMSFKHYQEYCHNYQLLAEDVDLLRRSIPNWPVFNQGIEALSKSVLSIEGRSLKENKAMSLNDLLIKPIQRLCKYPLLLQELSKCTQIEDDPTSHNGIAQVLETVRDVVCQINDAPANPVSKTSVQRTVLLREMIRIPDGNIVHDIYEQLGPMHLCGVLHFTYQLHSHILGKYMVCTLFKSHFLIASVDYESRKLQAIACLYICDVKMDTLRNGRGLCCYRCLFSWKLLFKHQKNDFEFVLSASSAHEEKKWKTEFLKSTAISSDMPKPVQSELRGYTFLSLDLTPLDGVDSSEGQLPRRPSIHSTANPRPVYDDIQPIVIKKTHCPYQQNKVSQDAGGEIERPKTPSSPALVLTSIRQDRIRLEKFISSIYSRESLKYPGMSLSNNDILFGPGSLMRRLTLRPVLHRRASSYTLPCTKSQIGDSNVFEQPNDKDHSKAKRRISSDASFNTKGETALSPRKLPAKIVQRSKTLRLKGKSKSTSELDKQAYKDESHQEYASMTKAFRTVFSSVSLKRPKRNRPGFFTGSEG